MPEDTYRRSWSREYRGLLIFLLDQSGSMANRIQIEDKVYTNGQMATAILNDMLATAVENTPEDDILGGIKDYCDIMVLGYGATVKELLSNGQHPISIKELPRLAKGHQKIQLERIDPRSGRSTIVAVERPVWVQTFENSDRTEMVLALERARDEVDLWLQQDTRRSYSHPPIIINITDGDHNGRGDPLELARQVRQRATNDGHILLFNCHLTSHAHQQRLFFPGSNKQFAQVIGDEEECSWAKTLFQMSSPIPQSMITKATKKFTFKTAFEPGARGFIYNASPIELIEFLRWGTIA